jgi:hypothetical protein
MRDGLDFTRRTSSSALAPLNPPLTPAIRQGELEFNMRRFFIAQVEKRLGIAHGPAVGIQLSDLDALHCEPSPSSISGRAMR